MDTVRMQAAGAAAEAVAAKAAVGASTVGAEPQGKGVLNGYSHVAPTMAVSEQAGARGDMYIMST